MKTKKHNIRAALQALAGLPNLSQAQVARRWHLDADTVRPILKAHRLPPVPGPWKHPRYAMADIWRIEGVPEPSILNQECHADLLKPLKTASELAAIKECDPATIRNWARDKTLPCVRLGTNIRFHASAKSEVRDGL